MASDRIYVVEVDTDKMGRHRTAYVGHDPDKAKEVADEEYVPREEKHGPLHAFIHVWEGGEHQFCTREHPEE